MFWANQVHTIDININIDKNLKASENSPKNKKQK